MRAPVAAAAVIALAVAGCGGGSDSDSDDRASQREAFEDTAVKFAQCMREHGVDVPDPEGGRLTLRAGPGEGGNSPQRVEKAQEACQHILEEGPRPPELSDEDREEFEQQALAFARCMRRQGIDMPDPEFEGGGRMRQRIGRRGSADPGDARFRAAEKKCEQFAPKPPDDPEGP